jgi:hypothetical protein
MTIREVSLGEAGIVRMMQRRPEVILQFWINIGIGADGSRNFDKWRSFS